MATKSILPKLKKQFSTNATFRANVCGQQKGKNYYFLY